MEIHPKKTIKLFLAIIFILLTCIVITLLIYREWMQVSIEKNRSIYSTDGIETLEKIKIGGIDQWIQIRGQSTSNPILLFLHGGPGSGGIAQSRRFQASWEHHFTVVQWDQRGAGKSYSDDIPRKSMSIKQMKADTIELVDYLRKRFDREKIFLVGHSWGSYLGISTIKSHPQWFYAYVGVGQIVNMQEGEKISYNYTMQKAKEYGDENAIAQLNELAPYPSENNMPEKTMTQRQWLQAYGGAIHRETSFLPLFKDIALSPEYSMIDVLNYFKGMFFSLNSLWPSIMTINIHSQGYDFETPLFFFAGRHDYNGPSELALDYFEKIQAPHKDFVWFENSAHSPMLEEPEIFYKELVSRVLAVK